MNEKLIPNFKKKHWVITVIAVTITRLSHGFWSYMEFTAQVQEICSRMPWGDSSDAHLEIAVFLEDMLLPYPATEQSSAKDGANHRNPKIGPSEKA